LAKKKKKREAVQNAIRETTEENELLHLEIERKKVIYDEREEILALSTKQRDELRKQLEDSVLQHDHLLAELHWKNQFGALEEGKKLMTENKAQLEKLRSELRNTLQSNQEKLANLALVHAKEKDKYRQMQTAVTTAKNQIDVATTWRRQLKRKIESLKQLLDEHGDAGTNTTEEMNKN